MKKRGYRESWVVLLSFTLGSCVSTGPQVSTPTETGSAPVAQPGDPGSGVLVPAVKGIPVDPGPTGTYRIGAYDVLKIEVFQVPELSGQEQVNEQGSITMALIGDVKVAGLTAQEAETAIAARLEPYLQNPQVDVFVAESASQRVTVTGHVRSPGVFPLTGRMTLMQVIALAGGVDNLGKKSEVLVFRKNPSGEMRAYVVDLAKIEEGGTRDPAILSDDRIFVPESGARVLTNTVRGILTGWVTRVPF